MEEDPFADAEPSNDADDLASFIDDSEDKGYADTDESDTELDPAFGPGPGPGPEPSKEPEGQPLYDEQGELVGSFVASSESPATTQKFVSVEVPDSTLVIPRYKYAGHELPAPQLSEAAAIAKLLVNCRPGDTFIELQLDEFAIYTWSPTSAAKGPMQQRYLNEMRPLQHLCTMMGSSTLYVDGVLSYKGQRFFVSRIPFQELPIGNYDPDEHTVGDQIWIRSNLNAKKLYQGCEVYYQLKKPATEYARFHHGFLWIADLAKHVVDYLAAMRDQQERVSLRHFRSDSDFYQWLLRCHGTSQIFRGWLTSYRSTDFCVAINASLEFIYKEVVGVLGEKEAHYHTIWKEIRSLTAYRPSVSTDDLEKAADAFDEAVAIDPPANRNTKTNRNQEDIPLTVVTPYVYECFKGLPFVDMMEPVGPSEQTNRLRHKVNDMQHLELSADLHQDGKCLLKAQDKIGLGREIRIGDVISTPRDEDVQSHWATEVAAGFSDVNRWFGVVQKIHTKRGNRSFDVIWIYRPVDTLCGSMRYPWNNEFFLSDHCSCKDGLPKIKESEVIGIHHVEWGGNSNTKGFFCRQTYLHEERRWVTFNREHLTCTHGKQTKPFEYAIGDTVLVRVGAKDMYLEPCELLALPTDDEQGILIRVLPRRSQVQPDRPSPPNELVFTKGEDSIQLSYWSRVYGRCLVRYFREDEALVAPYDRDGVGNAFFLRTYLAETETGQQCLPLYPSDPNHALPASFKQGFNPRNPVQKLKGYDLFCGGGNFGRGLEESGAIEMKWCNDLSARAVHTYMANATGETKPFIGSIDDVNRKALNGTFSANVPPIGDVDFVSAGSPCPGFSRLTLNKTTPAQRKNQSLVAAFATFVDTYRPKYGLLENVAEIIQSKKDKTEDVFCQLICALVGLGYQAHFFLLDAWTFGSPQSRTRVFLAFAAPGYRLPEKPMQSHQHGERRTKRVGALPNGQFMAERDFPHTAFPPIDIGTAVGDLPDIADAKPDYCIPFPDHRQSYGVTRPIRAQISVIPNRPYGMNFSKAYYDEGVISEADRWHSFPKRGSKTQKISRGWGRVHPHRLMSTVTTTPQVTDAYAGCWTHWSQNRVITVMEARRAQGFRDHEVVLGSRAEQWLTVGNSVAREVSLALGISFREAWLGSLVKGDESLNHAQTRNVDASAAAAHATPVLIESDLGFADTDEDAASAGNAWVNDYLFEEEETETISSGTGTPLSLDQLPTPATSVPAWSSAASSSNTPTLAKRKLPSTIMVEEMAAKRQRTPVAQYTWPSGPGTQQNPLTLPEDN